MPRPSFRPSPGLFFALALTVLPGCVSPAGDTPEAMRASARAMRERVLAEARAEYPGLQADLERAPAWAVIDTGIFKTIIGHASGYGIVHDRRSGQETYVSQSIWAFGPLLEFGHSSSVLVFHDPTLLDELLAGDTKFGADADVAFKFGSFGGDAAAVALSNRLSVYRLFQTGVGLNATLLWISIEPDPDLGS